jgi:Holliday junction resolvasome RuvABC endonuclease subunit
VKQDKKLVIAGIDYSMTCPAMTIHTGNEWSFDNCKFYYYTSEKKSLFPSDKFVGKLYEPWENNIERFCNLSEFFLMHINHNKVNLIYIEGYSYSSKGQVFSIGENGGILKWKLYDMGYDFGIIDPSSIKKFATGKGNSKKDDMYRAFCVDTSLNLCDTLSIKNENKSPCSDIVDSYFICKYAFYDLKGK